MSRLTVSRTGLVMLTLVGWSLGLSGWLYTTQQQVARLERGGVDPAVVAGLRSNLDGLAQTQGELQAQARDWIAAFERQARYQTTLDVRLEAQQQAIAHLRDALTEAAPQQAVADLGKRLDTLDGQLAALRAARRAEKAAQPARAVKVSAAPRPAAAPPALPPSPPFTPVGIESRGGERFLVLSPPGAHALGQIRLLARGERFGTWQLQRLDRDSALFQVAGHADQRVQVL